MNRDSIPPPGEGPIDPYIKEIDALGFALSRSLCLMMWADEHAQSFVEDRKTDPELAEQELKYLLHCIPEARQHLRRARDLLLAGYTFDPSKRLPEGLEEQ